jgi:hypothetical protein
MDLPKMFPWRGVRAAGSGQKRIGTGGENKSFYCYALEICVAVARPFADCFHCR